MTTTTDLKAAKKFGPGYFIREQMELRDWTQSDLAEVTGFTVKHLNKVLQDKQQLTLDMARVLGEVFNTSAQYWMNIDTSYRLWLSQKKSKGEIEADIKGLIYERMPIRDMIAKGWIRKSSSTGSLKKQVLNYWGWERLDFSILDKDYLPGFTRKSTAYNQFNASYAITWFRKAQLEAASRKAPPYKKVKLERLYNNLNSYTTKDNGVNQFIEDLSQVGVIFFVLPHLQKTYLDGAAFYSGKNPVIVYTARYKRIDNFWFTVAHEIAHILLHLNKDNTFILDNLRDGELDQLEIEANALAAEKLKHAEINEFLSPYLNYLSSSRVEECMQVLNVHPSIIIGKLAHEKAISYSQQKLYNENVLDFIDEGYKI
ncbi:MAG: ImmA/IrrE family metallo-endopeptidase [Flavobacteriales bacterium]|jgi:HTH-type transcriptional regulator/antitoxin HigA